MKPILITTAILAAAAVLEFLDTYPVIVDHDEKANKMEIVRRDNGHSFEIRLEHFNETEAPNILRNFFYFLDSENPESVTTDWNFFVERDTVIAQTPDPKFGADSVAVFDGRGVYVRHFNFASGEYTIADVNGVEYTVQPNQLSTHTTVA